MPCYHPIPVWQRPDRTIAFQATNGALREFHIPCGQCVGCRIKRASTWATRCVHEAQLHVEKSFLTLTYDDTHLPANGSLHYPDFQKFLKRVRKAYPDTPIRFFMCGEYGEALGRPHYHALMFGYRPSDMVSLGSVGKRAPLFRSASLDQLWGKGHASVGEFTAASANYVAKYCIKKINGEHSELHYSRLDPSTGLLVAIEPEFAHMSLKPGIGLEWFVKYHKELHTHDAAIINGRKVPVPRYYDKKTQELHGETYDSLAYKRYLDSLEILDDQTPERLAVRETVAKAKLATTKRVLK